MDSTNKPNAAKPETLQNNATFEVTRLHLEQATELAREAGDMALIPALLVSLAINKQTLQQSRDTRRP
jgi:hypothetical protein